MKQGIGKGYNAGCCNVFDIWGPSSHSPNFNGTTSTPSNGAYDLQLSYDLERPLRYDLDGTYSHEVRPELWARGEQSWTLYAAMIPGTYPPPPGLAANKPSSSRADGTWSVALCTAGEHHSETNEFDEPLDWFQRVSRCQGTRAIYIDGHQTHLVYRTTGLDLDGMSDEEQNAGNTGGDHHLIRISDQTKIATYSVHSLGISFPFSEMEEDWLQSIYINYGEGIHTNILESGFTAQEYIMQQWACNLISHGIEYCNLSSYKPGKSQWSAARLKYDGTRPTNGSGGTAAGLEVFCTEADQSTSSERIGDPEEDYVGNYWLVMPTCRVYIDTSADTPDECWWIAINKDPEEDIRIVTGRWLSKVYAGTASDWTGYADGTLADSEVENIVLDMSDTDYPEEDAAGWPNIQIRSYNRVYNPVSEQNEDLVLFTTQDGSFTQADDVEADFEGGDLNSGLEDAEIEFKTGGQVDTSGWVSTASVTYGSDTPIAGSYSAHTNPVSLTTVQSLFLSLSFNKISAGYITFKYRHHNRIWGMPGSGVGTQLFNIPVTENYLDIRLDGSIIAGDARIDEENPLAVGNAIIEVDNGSGWALVASSRIDNSNSPEDCTGDEDKFLLAREVRIWVAAGTHTIHFIHQRGSDENDGTFSHLYSQVDDLFLDDLMTGEDTTGKRRWMSINGKVQKAEWWAWPRREEEEKTDLTLRVSTAPDFITYDKLGRVLYGNPHYVVRLIPNEDDPGFWKLDTDFGGPRGDGFDSSEDESNGGYIRFTATNASVKQALGEETPGCDDPDPDYNWVDVVADPPWGAMQILPVGSGGDFQLRGMNASLRDATEHPYKSEDFPYKTPGGQTLYEKFAERMRVYSNRWSQRAHSWTVTNDGKHLRPHVDVVWRPTRYTEAYPGPDSWPSPPWQTFFETADSTTLYGYGALRPRDPLRVTGSWARAKWTLYNSIISTTFDDSLKQEPQAVWVRSVGNDIDGLDPDVSGPLQSAHWQLVTARFTPTRETFVTYNGPGLGDSINTDENCDSTPESPVHVVMFRPTITGVRSMYGWTDYDAVDVQCVCCD